MAFQDGTQDEIYVERLHLIADRAKVLQETGAIKIISNRLSPAGALDLLQWLEIHRHELEEANAQQTQPLEVTQVTGYPPDGSNYHDHLCRCPGCDPQPPDNA